MNRPDLSVVIPFLNEEGSLPILKERFRQLDELPEHFEIVFIADGSTDGSVAFVEQWAAEDPRIKLAVLSRNFGHQAAISAGLELASGQYVGIMDADLQDPPEILMKMYRLALEGNWDIVCSVRTSRSGRSLKKAGYRIFYRLYDMLAEAPVDPHSGDFSVMNRRAVDALLALPEKVRFVRGLRSWIGFRVKTFPTERPARAAGTAQYSWGALFSLAFHGLTSFSARPLRIATLTGSVLCVGSATLALIYVGLWILYDIHSTIPGFTTIVLLLLFLSGVQFFMLGIIGEYIGQIFVEVKNRPTYLIARTVNMNGEHGEGSEE